MRIKSMDAVRPLTRAGSMLRLVELGILDMGDRDPDRILHGLCSVIVFGRAATSAMRTFQRFDREAFDRWFRPWNDELEHDPLLFDFFGSLRDKLLHGVSPEVAIVLAVQGVPDLPVGAIRLVNHPLPETHRGQPITDQRIPSLCRVYLAFLTEMRDSFNEIVWPVVDRRIAAMGT